MRYALLSVAFMMGVNGYAQLAAEPDWVEFIAPSVSQTIEITRSGIIPMLESHQLNGMKSNKINKLILEEIRAQIEDELLEPGTVVSALRVTGYGTPIGNWSRNQEKSNTMAAKLKNYLAKTDIGCNSLNVGWVTEDWDSLLVLVQHSNLPLAHAAGDIIRSVEASRGREAQLQMLGDGSFYKAMVKEMFPKVSRIEWTAKMTRAASGTSQGVLTIEGSSREVSLSDLYLLACRFPKGSADFCNAIRLCERYYPDNDVAQLNSAAVSLIRGEIEKAAQVLEFYKTDPRAYNNIGVLNQLRGYKEQAKVYYQLASSNGSAVAARRFPNILVDGIIFNPQRVKSDEISIISVGNFRTRLSDIEGKTGTYRNCLKNNEGIWDLYDTDKKDWQQLFWASDETSAATFTAYAGLGKGPANKYNNNGTFTFSTSGASGSLSDFMVARTHGVHSDFPNMVPLEFQHALSKIQIKAIYNYVGSDSMKPLKDLNIKVKSVKINNVYGRGSLTIPTKKNADSDLFKWTVNGRSDQSYVVNLATPLQLMAGSEMSIDGNSSDAFMLIPQRGNMGALVQKGVWAGTYLSVCINVTRASDGSSVYPANASSGGYIWVIVPIKPDWQANKKYTYVLEFTESNYGIKAQLPVTSYVEDWID